MIGVRCDNKGSVEFGPVLRQQTLQIRDVLAIPVKVRPPTDQEVRRWSSGTFQATMKFEVAGSGAIDAETQKFDGIPFAEARTVGSELALVFIVRERPYIVSIDFIGEFGVYIEDVRSGGTYSFSGDYASQSASMAKPMIVAKMTPSTASSSVFCSPTQ